MAIGEVVRITGDGWIQKVSVEEALVGDEAAARLKTVNMFNKAPEAGNIQVLARVKVGIEGDEVPDVFTKWDRSVWSLVAAGRAFDRGPVVVLPEPKFEGEIIPPGEIEGWVVFEAPETEELALVYLRTIDRGGWWFALPSGSAGSTGSEGGSLVAPAPVDPTVPPSVAVTTGVTLANFNRLQDGMSYDEAVAILGVEGRLLSQTDLAGIQTVMYSWTGEGSIGANMNAMFQNGKLISKAQFGLK